MGNSKRGWRSLGGLLAALMPLWSNGCQQGQLSFADVESGAVDLAEAEGMALRRLLAETGLKPTELDLSGRIGAPNSARIEDGHVRSLILTDLALHDFATLAALTKLQRVRIEGGRLTLLSGLNSGCELRSLYVNSANLVDPQGLGACTRLTDLSLPNNDLVALPDLQMLRELRHLDLSDNALAGALEITGLPQLESLNLANNALSQCPAIHDLPKLQRLLLSHNQLPDLSGLNALPALRDLLVDHNALQDASSIDQFAQLVVVNLNHNQLRHFPLLVSNLDPLHWSANPGYLRRLAADHDERRAKLTASSLSSELPPATGSTEGFSAGNCRWSGSRPSCELTIARIEGAQRIYLARWKSNPLRTDPRRRGISGVVVRLTVADGVVRAYLSKQAQTLREAEANPDPVVRVGYPYVEAATDDPKALAGNLINDSSGIWLLLESRNGSAAGVELRIEAGYVP